MAKRGYVILNSVALVLFNIVFWVCNYYPRHIVADSSNAPTAIIINFVMFIIHIFLMFTFFGKNSTLFEKNQFTKGIKICSAIFKCMLLLCVQLLFELLIHIFEINGNIFVISYLLILTVWTIDYYILTYGSKHKVQRSKTTLAVFTSIAIITMICIFTDGLMVANLQKHCAKYCEDSSRLHAIRTNYNFLHSTITLFFDSFVACTLVFLHASRIEKIIEYSNGSNSLNVTRITARVWIMLIIALGLVSLKANISPPSLFKSVDVFKSTTYSHTDDNNFDDDFYILQLYRIGDNLEPKLCYGYRKIILRCNNRKIVSFVTPFSDEVEGFTKYNINGNFVSIYGNRAICYIENDTPHVVLFEDIYKHAYNVIVIETCKTLISDGNIIVFEYANEYLKQYAPDFIAPYINRYSTGEFNTSELNVLNEFEYRPDYISNIANSAK